MQIHESYKSRETEVSVNLRPMLYLKDGQSFIIKCDAKRATSYASKNKVRIQTKKISIIDPSDLTESDGLQVTIVKQKEEPPKDKRPSWQQAIAEMPKTKEAEMIKLLLNKMYKNVQG